MGPAQPIAKPVVTSSERIERQYNNVLASRWLGYTVRACLLSSSVTLVILWSTAGFRQTAIIPLAVLALGATVFGVYPVLSAHRLALMYPSPPPSQSTFLALITSELRAQRSWWLVLAHALCGAVFTVAYSLARSLYGVEARLGIFSSTSRHPWHLNERFIYLLSANVTAGMLTAAAHVVQRRITLTWPTTWAPLSTRVRIALAYVSNPFQASSVAVPAAAMVAHALVYGLLRRSVITTALAVLPVLRPFFVNFARSSRSPVWAVRGDVVWLVAMTTIASQVYTRLQNPYLTQPPDFVALIRGSPLKPEAYLLDALRIKSTYHLHFTLSELRRFSSDPARRQRLFADVPSSTHAQPTVLNIWEQLLLHLGRRHAALTARTAKRVAPRAAPVADSHTLRTKQADIFRPAAPPKNGVVSALQSVLDGPVAIQPPAVVARSEQLAIEASKAASEAILRAESRVQQRVEGNAWGGLVVSGIKGVWTGSVRTWDAKTRYIGREWAVRGVRAAVRDVELLEGLLDVIVTIAVASLEEDTYGYIQRVLPGTLELIVRHRAELISTRAELLAGSASLGSSAPAAKAEVEQGMGRPIELCERAIQRMGDAFGQTLEAFRFPVAVGRVLTEVCHREEGGEAQEAGRQ